MLSSKLHIAISKLLPQALPAFKIEDLGSRLLGHQGRQAEGHWATLATLATQAPLAPRDPGPGGARERQKNSDVGAGMLPWLPPPAWTP